ncbi:hypothetical protein ACHWQZ_G012806 [Mnemiopsis leidyi]
MDTKWIQFGYKISDSSTCYAKLERHVRFLYDDGIFVMTRVNTCVRPRFTTGAYEQADPQDPAAVTGTPESYITPTTQIKPPATQQCFNNKAEKIENKMRFDDVEETEKLEKMKK